MRNSSSLRVQGQAIRALQRFRRVPRSRTRAFRRIQTNRNLNGFAQTAHSQRQFAGLSQGHVRRRRNVNLHFRPAAEEEMCTIRFDSMTTDVSGQEIPEIDVPWRLNNGFASTCACIESGTVSWSRSYETIAHTNETCTGTPSRAGPCAS